MNDPIPEIQPYYVSIKAKAWAAWKESATLTLLHSYVRDRASEVFIDKNSINHRVPCDKRLASLGDSGLTRERGETKRAKGNHFVADRGNNAMTRESGIHVPLIYDPAARLFGISCPQ